MKKIVLIMMMVLSMLGCGKELTKKELSKAQTINFSKFIKEASKYEKINGKNICHVDKYGREVFFIEKWHFLYPKNEVTKVYSTEKEKFLKGKYYYNISRYNKSFEVLHINNKNQITKVITYRDKPIGRNHPASIEVCEYVGRYNKIPSLDLEEGDFHVLAERIFINTNDNQDLFVERETEYIVIDAKTKEKIETFEIGFDITTRESFI